MAGLSVPQEGACCPLKTLLDSTPPLSACLWDQRTTPGEEGYGYGSDESSSASPFTPLPAAPADRAPDSMRSTECDCVCPGGGVTPSAPDLVTGGRRRPGTLGAARRHLTGHC